MKIKIRQYLPEILTGVGIGGEILADILFVKAAKEESKDGKKTHYILPIAASGISIASIFASNRISSKEKTALIAALGLSAASSTRYRKAVKETVSAEESEKIQEKYEESEFEELLKTLDNMNLNDGGTKMDSLFYFPQLHLLIRASPDEVHVSIMNLNETFTTEGCATVENFYNFLTWNSDTVKIPEANRQYSDEYCWEIFDEDPESGVTEITIQEYIKQLNREPVTIIMFSVPPMTADEWEDYYDRIYEE